MSLIVRADAGAATGVGHVMRCLALAQAWRALGRSAIFVYAEMTPALATRLSREDFGTIRLKTEPGSLSDAKQTMEVAIGQAASWIVVDGYQFGEAWHRQIKQGGFRLLEMNDSGQSWRHCADLVINQNLHSSSGDFAREAGTRLLLGPHYVLLRDEFVLHPVEQRRTRPVARTVLVTLGGADPSNVTAMVVRALKPLSGLEFDVVLGPANPHGDAITRSIGPNNSAWRLRANPSNLRELMENADLVVSAAGSTSWELAFLGVPMALIVVADNQTPIASALAARGAAANLGQYSKLSVDMITAAVRSLVEDPNRRSKLGQQARETVDGRGRLRVLAHMRAAELTLRRATSADAEAVWKWANQRRVRDASFTSSEIRWEEHQRWFDQKLRDSTCHFYLGFHQGSPAGQIRFDLGGEIATVSVALAPEFHGQRLGPSLILAGCDRLFRDSTATIIEAHIKEGNRASRTAFEIAGFSPLPDSIQAAPTAIHLRLTKQDHE